MKIILMVVGKTTTPTLKAGIDDYTRRIGRYYPFEIIEIPDIKNTRKLSAEQQKEAEGKAIMARLHPSDHVVLLDERGRELTSREFAVAIERLSASLPRNLVYIVGGPYGFSPEVYARANGQLSLSRMTFPHEMVRLFFTEQIYRAFTILNNTPYHHD